MNILIYLIIILLFFVLIFWTWNSTKEYENISKRIIYIFVGIIAILFITYIFFNISKVGITYPKQEMVKQVRKIAILIFTPINGFLSLPHIALIKTKIESKSEEEEKIKKRIIILAIIFIVSTIIEINYMKGFQNGIIQMLNKK